MNTKKIILATLGAVAVVTAASYGAFKAMQCLKAKKAKEEPSQEPTAATVDQPAATEATQETPSDAEEPGEPLLTGLYAQYQNGQTSLEKELAVHRIIRVLEQIHVAQFEDIEATIRNLVGDERKMSEYIAEGLCQANNILIREVRQRIQYLREQFNQHQGDTIRSESRARRSGQLVFTRIYKRADFEAFVETFNDYEVRFAALKERLQENPTQETFRDFEIKHDEFIGFLGIADRLKNPHMPFDIACEQILNPDYKEELENRPIRRRVRQPYRAPEKS